MTLLRTLLLAEVDEQIARREKFETRDFMTTEYLSWSSIILGAASPVSAAFGAGKPLIAILGAMSGLLVAIDKAFTFSKRSNWNAQYKLALKSIRYRLTDPQSDENALGDQLIKVHQEWNSKFPGSKG